MKRSQQQQQQKKNSEVMGIQKLFSAPGNVLIKTTLLKSLAEALYSAPRRYSYQNKYEEKTAEGGSSLHSALAHFRGSVLVLQAVETLR